MYTTSQVVFLTVCFAVIAQESYFERDLWAQRSDFVLRYQDLPSNCDTAFVLQSLGQPDVIIDETHDSASLWMSASALSLWCYGATEDNPFPTIGSVEFDGSGTLVGLNYRLTRMPNAQLTLSLSEDAIQENLRRINRVLPIRAGQRHDPKTLIAISNELRPLGKETIILLFREYMRIVPAAIDNYTGLPLLLRTLFRTDVVRPDYNDLFSGGAFPPHPSITDADGWRLRLADWPVLVMEDIPIILVEDYFLSGEPSRTIYEQIDWYDAHGVLRSGELMPEHLPVEVLQMLEERFPGFFNGRTGRARHNLVVAQIFNLFDDVISDEAVHLNVALRLEGSQRITRDMELNRRLNVDTKVKVLDAISALPLTWDSTASRFRRSF